MKIKSIFRKMLPHAVIIMMAMIATLCILDYYNPLMGFLTRGMSKVLIFVCMVSVIIYMALKFGDKLKDGRKM